MMKKSPNYGERSASCSLEVERVVDLCLEMSPMADLLDIGTGSGLFAEAFAAPGCKSDRYRPRPGHD